MEFSIPRIPQRDQYLPLLPLPLPDLLHLPYNWNTENKKRLELAGMFLAQNDELIDLLTANLKHRSSSTGITSRSTCRLLIFTART